MSGVGLATWNGWAPNGFGSMGAAHGEQHGVGPWTAGTVRGGPRPLLPLLSLAHGAPCAPSGLGTAAPSSTCLAAVLLARGELTRSRAVVARRGC